MHSKRQNNTQHSEKSRKSIFLIFKLFCFFSIMLGHICSHILYRNSQSPFILIHSYEATKIPRNGNDGFTASTIGHSSLYLTKWLYASNKRYTRLPAVSTSQFTGDSTFISSSTKCSQLVYDFSESFSRKKNIMNKLSKSHESPSTYE